MNEAKQCHLGFIQSIITRMAGNSFLLRGWSITLVAAIFSLASKDADGHLVFVAYYAAILFWTLDAYYTRQERLYRRLYEKVANDEIGSLSYTLDTTLVTDSVPPLYKIFISKIIFIFHLPIIILISFVISILAISNKI